MFGCFDYARLSELLRVCLNVCWIGVDCWLGLFALFASSVGWVCLLCYCYLLLLIVLFGLLVYLCCVKLLVLVTDGLNVA